VEFARKGYYNTEVASIAERAGVSKGTIYNYFDNKEAILMGVICAGFERLGDRMKRISTEKADPVDRISSALHEYLEFFDHHRAFFRVLIKEAVHIVPKAREEYRRYLVAHVGYLERLIDAGTVAGKLAKVDSRLAALCLLEMCDAVTKGSLLMNRKLNVDKDHKTIMRIFLHGIEKR
jgi:AcrR family transcriptional regulator